MATTGLALFNPHAAAVPALGAGLVGGAGGGLLHQAAWARGGRSDVVVDAGTGAASSAVLAMATSPYRRVLVLLQTQHANPRLTEKFTPHASSKFSFTWLRCLSNIVQTQGFFSLWRGNCACLAGILPQTFATLCVHDRIVGGITSWLRPRQQDKPLSRAANLIASLSASCASASIVGAFTYPFALGYTRLAADVGSTHKAHPREFTGLFMGACSGGSSPHLHSLLSLPWVPQCSHCLRRHRGQASDLCGTRCIVTRRSRRCGSQTACRCLGARASAVPSEGCGGCTGDCLCKCCTRCRTRRRCCSSTR
eukprot:COSAG01_NODE_15603_length_1327_cov_1.428337_2_plen_309_part_00